MIGLTDGKLIAHDSDSRQKARLPVQVHKLNIAKQELRSESTMIHFISFVFLVSMLQSMDSIKAQTQNQLGSKRTQQCTINNNFYAGPNKKVENIMFEMKKQLDEI